MWSAPATRTTGSYQVLFTSARARATPPDDGERPADRGDDGVGDRPVADDHLVHDLVALATVAPGAAPAVGVVLACVLDPVGDPVVVEITLAGGGDGGGRRSVGVGCAVAVAVRSPAEPGAAAGLDGVGATGVGGLADAGDRRAGGLALVRAIVRGIGLAVPDPPPRPSRRGSLVYVGRRRIGAGGSGFGGGFRVVAVVALQQVHRPTPRGRPRRTCRWSAG